MILKIIISNIINIINDYINFNYFNFNHVNYDHVDFFINKVILLNDIVIH